MMKTLLIVDPQIDFMPGGQLAVPEGNEIIQPINAIISNYDLVVATQDWHPEHHISFAENHTQKQAFESIQLPNGASQTLWPTHCIQGEIGAEFHPELNTKPIEAIFRKGLNPQIDSYSGFFDNLKQKDTGLSGYLKSKGVIEFDICGLAGDICVYFTVKDALEFGFKVNLIESATKALNLTTYNQQKTELHSLGVKYQ